MHPAPPSSETLTRTEQPGQRPVTSASPPPLPAGATLGRYVVMQALGEGGMGVVYAAHDFVLDRRVAVKLVRPDLQPSEREARKARLVAEAQAVARLSHPNVIAVYDVGEFGGEIYIAMELVEGKTLQDWLRAQPRPLEEILEVFAQAGLGLAAAHQLGLVHRDFKPHNVLVGADGRVRVTDFGLAVSQGTAAGDGAGTPAYMAPEQADGKGSPRADQYSFGVALQEAITGARPGQDGAAAAPPRWLRRIIERTLRPAGERFPSMDALLAALALGRRSRERTRRWMTTAGVASAAALASAVAVYRPPAAIRAAERLEVLVHRVAQSPALAWARPAPAVQAAEPVAPRAEVVEARSFAAAAAPVATAAPRTAPAPRDEVRRRPAEPRLEPSLAPAKERHDPSWVAALEKLVRALRDLGLVDDDLRINPPTAVAGMMGDEVEPGEGVSWAPLSWMLRPERTASFSSIKAATIPRLGELQGAVEIADDPVELAEARFALAQALWDSDPERALRLVEQARAALQSDDATASTELLGKITEWLQARQSK